jgi:hypothetical protein
MRGRELTGGHFARFADMDQSLRSFLALSECVTGCVLYRVAALIAVLTCQGS